MELRATIRRGEVTLVPMEQVMVEGGPLAVLTRAALEPDVSLADVSYDEELERDEREVQIEFLANDNDFARRTLKRWARAAGHGRLWFADELYEPRSLPPVPRMAVTSCRCCGLVMRDNSESFWALVHGSGLFPPFCFACGATVPQWIPDPPARRIKRSERVRPIRSHRDAIPERTPDSSE